jgi:hypothetical protein
MRLPLPVNPVELLGKTLSRGRAVVMVLGNALGVASPERLFELFSRMGPATSGLQMRYLLS